MAKVEQTEGYLEGKILIAMPNMADPRFSRSVIFLCAHNAEGAMGLVLNKHLESLSFGELLSQLEIRPDEAVVEHRVHFGGPVESGRGFVLHSDDYTQDGTLKIGSGIALTETIDILRAIARGDGPLRALMALGYAGWGPGQLESEIHDNAWLHASADSEIVFDEDLGAKWERAMAKLGIGLDNLSGASGHA
ncbi:MAG: YqgE/AlgH family protein [Alphaproteobacteria bacterium]|nr:YqgE/AlgH family protein [Alphaproteobacteria bacterium]